jgi:hypothetical protein
VAQDNDERDAPAAADKRGLWLLNRRDFLRLAATSATAACGPMMLVSCEGCDSDVDPPGPVARWIPIRRPDDLLAMDLGLINLEDVDGELVRIDAGEPAYLVLRLPGQHLHEEVVNLDDDPPDRRFEALLAGPSRLVFEVSDELEAIPFDLEGVLAVVRTSALRVSVQAAPAGTPSSDSGSDPGSTFGIAATPFEAASGGERGVTPPAGGMALVTTVRSGHHTRQTQAMQLAAAPPAPPPPGPAADLDVTAPEGPEQPGRPKAPRDDETAIEFPARLILSPHQHVRFVHDDAPHASSDGRTALWHTRMVPVDQNGALAPHDKARSTVRAIWARRGFDPDRLIDPPDPGPIDDLQNNPDASNVRGPLTADTREQIVHQSSNFEDLVDYETGDKAAPLPIRVDQLMLTSLGAFFDGQGDWTQKEGLNLLRWAQRSTLGRDHYVEVAFAGYLYPWGHRAVYVEIVQRIVPAADQEGDRRAYLQKHAVIIIAEQDLIYDPGGEAAEAIESELRQTPVRRARLLDLVSPKLVAADEQNTPYRPELANGQDYLFSAQVFDAEGREHKAQLPAVWVPGGRRDWRSDFTNQERGDIRALHAAIGATSFGGRRIAFTPPDGDHEAMRFETQSITFVDSELSADAQSDSGVYLPFLPRMIDATIGLDAARGLLQTGDDQTVTFTQAFLDHGFSGDNAELQLLFQLGEELPMKFSSQSDKSGGFIAPDMAVKAVSRARGLIGGDMDKLNAGTIDVADVFPGDVGSLLPKLFGAVSLTDVLDALGLDVTPKLVTSVQDELGDLLSDIARLTAEIEGVPGNVDGWIEDHLARQAGGYLQGDGAAVAALEDALESLKDDLTSVIDDLTSAFDELLMHLGNGEYTDALSVLTGVADPDDAGAPLTRLIDLLAQIPFFPVAAMKRLRAAAERLNEVLSVAEKLEPIFEAVENAQEMLEQRIIRLEWSPPLKGDPAGFFVPHKSDGFSLGVEARPQAVGGKPAGADVFCSLESFDVVLFPASPVITIGFERIVFEVRAGQKPDIDVVLAGLTFGGPLKFIEKIKEALPLDGFSDPPEIDVDVTGLRASIDFPIPSIAVGIFSLENLAISAGLHVPFIGDAIRLKFGFCSKESPFILTVSMLGGGGYVGISLTPKGLDRLEVALEFGASLSVNFGVASGGVSIVAGIFIAVEAELVELTGYFRFRGYVTVLGIIGASIELGMELTYKKIGSASKVVGRAWLIIEITVLCFSKSVKVEAERKLSGDAEDPTFAEVMAPLPAPADPVMGSDQPNTPWANYVNAFA